METYASAGDYAARYGAVADAGTLQACLEDCTAVIAAELEAHGIDPSARGEGYADRLMRVCRSMAGRVMPQTADAVPAGVTQMSQTFGPYSLQATFGATYGTPRMLPSERRLLGIGARIGTGAIA